MTDNPIRETCGTCRHYDDQPECDPYQRCRRLAGCWTNGPNTPACTCWERVEAESVEHDT